MQVLNIKDTYDKLNNGYYLVASPRDIDTDRDIALAHTIHQHGDYLYWRNYGSSAEDNTLTGLDWILKTIFDKDNYYMLLTQNEYYDACNRYYEEERNKRNVSN